MKTKVLSVLLAGCLLVLAAWLVHQNNSRDFHSPAGFAPSAQAGERNENPAGAVPEKYRDTVRKGLEYLAKNQHKDGHWEGDDGKHPVAMTGMVGLALLMENDAPPEKRRRNAVRAAKYSANIAKAANWLLDNSQARRDGLIFSGHPSETARYMQGHGLATLFLAGVCQEEHEDAGRQKELRAALKNSVQYIVKAQSTQGGWYNTSRLEGHDLATIAPTVIQIQALHAAASAGVGVPGAAVIDALAYLKTSLEKYESGAKARQNHNRRLETAGALACFCSGRPVKDKSCDQWLKYCQAEIPEGRDIQFGRGELIHLYYAQALVSLSLGREQGHAAWNDYRTEIFDLLQSMQNEDGSWRAGDGLGVGPVYATAVWCTVLQLDNGNHPAMQRIPTAVK